MPCYDASRPATPHPIAHASLPSPVVQDQDLGSAYARSASPYSYNNSPSSVHDELPRYGSPKLEVRHRDLRSLKSTSDIRRAVYNTPFDHPSPEHSLRRVGLSRSSSPAPFAPSPLATVPPQTLRASPETRLENFKFPAGGHPGPPLQVKRRPSALRFETRSPKQAPPHNPDFVILPSPPPRGGPFDHEWSNPLPGFVPYPNQQCPAVPSRSGTPSQTATPLSPRTVENINRIAGSIGVKTSVYEDHIWTT
ncbi:hypothetical protein BDZ89DRAFT_1060552 [Hymenopellis radicata]|nr:hypothetical protein BDZ89DRAFT_1060552 [Hymenopellis radicata]